MSSNLSSLLLGGVMNAAGSAPPDKKPETSPTPPPAGGGFDFTQFGGGATSPAPIEDKVKTRLSGPLTGLATGRAYKENMPLALKALELIKGNPSSIDSHLRSLGGSKFSTEEMPTDLHVFGHRYSNSKNAGLQSAMRDAYEYYTRALTTPVGATGFGSSEEKADAIKHASEMVEKLSAAKDDSNPVDYTPEHDAIKRNLVHARQGWNKSSESFASTQGEVNKNARDENAQDKRRAVGTLIKHFVDREHNDILGINKSAAIAHADLIKLQAYLGKNPSDVTIDEFIDTPIGRSLVESIGDRLDSVGAWDYPAGRKLLKRIKSQSADSKSEADKISWGRQQLAGLGEPTPGEDPTITTKREQFKTAINNSEEILREKQTPLSDTDFSDFGGAFRVGEDVRSRLRPSNPDRILKSDLTGENNTPSNRGKYGAGVRNWETDVKAFTDALRSTGSDVTADQVKAASERLGRHGTSQFLGTMLGATSKTPVPYIGEHGQHTYTFSGITPEGQMSEQDIAQQQGQSNNRLTGYGEWGTRPKFQGALLAGLGLTDQQLNELAGKAGIKNPDQINDFKEAARMSPAAANTNAALQRLHDLMQITDTDENGNPIAVQTTKRGIATFGGQIGKSTSAMLERLHEMDVNGETNNNTSVSSRKRILGETVGSAYGELTTSSKGSATSESWSPFALGDQGVNPWAPVTHTPTPRHSVQLIGSMLGVSKDNSQYRSDVNKLLDYVYAKATGNEAGIPNTNIRIAADTFNSGFKRTARHLITLAERDPGIRDEFMRAGLDGLDWADSNKFIAQLAKWVQEPNNARRIEGLISRTADQQTRNIPPVRGQRNLSSPTENKAIRGSVTSSLDRLEQQINGFVRQINKMKTEGVEFETTQTDADGNEVKVKKTVKGTDPEFARILAEERQKFIEENRSALSTAFKKAFISTDDEDIKLLNAKENLGETLTEDEIAKRNGGLDSVVGRYLDYANAKIGSLLNPDDAQAKAQVADLLKKASDRTGLTERAKTQAITDKEASARGAEFLADKNLNITEAKQNGFWDHLNRNRFNDIQTEIGHLQDKLSGITELDDVKAAQQEVDRLSKIENPDSSTKNALTLATDKLNLMTSRLNGRGQGRLAYKLSQAKTEEEKAKVTKEIDDARNQLDNKVQAIKNLLSPDLPYSQGGPMTEKDYRANQDEHFRVLTNSFDNLSPADQEKYWTMINDEWRKTGKKPEGLPFQLQDYGTEDIKLKGAEYEGSKHALAQGWVARKNDKGELIRGEVPPMFNPESGKRNPNVRVRNVKDSDGENHIFLEHVTRSTDGREKIIGRQEILFDADPNPPSKTLTDSKGVTRPNPNYAKELEQWNRNNEFFVDRAKRQYEQQTRLRAMKNVDANVVTPAIDDLVKKLPDIVRKTVSLNQGIKSSEKTVADYVSANVDNDAFVKWAKDNNKDISTESKRTLQLVKYGAVKDVLKGAKLTAYKTKVAQLDASLKARESYHTSVGLSPKVAAQFNWNTSDQLATALNSATSDADKRKVLTGHPGFSAMINGKIDELKQHHYAKALPALFKNNEPHHRVMRDTVAEIQRLENMPKSFIEQGQIDTFQRMPAHVEYTRGKGSTIGGLDFESFRKKMTEGLAERRKTIDKSYTQLANYINAAGYKLPNGDPLRVSTVNSSNGKEGRQTLRDIFNIIEQHGDKYWNLLGDAMHDGYQNAGRGKLLSADSGKTNWTPEMRAFDEQLIRDAELELKKRQQYRGKRDPQFARLRRIQAENRAIEEERLGQERKSTKEFPPAGRNSGLHKDGNIDWMRADRNTEGYEYNGRYVRYDSREYKDLIKRATPQKDSSGKITAQDPEAVKELKHAILSQSERIYVKRGQVKVLRPGSKGAVWIPATKDHPERLLPVGSAELTDIETNKPHLLNNAYLVNPNGIKTAMQVVEAGIASKPARFVRLPTIDELGINAKHPMAKYAGTLVREDSDEHLQIKNISTRKAHTYRTHVVAPKDSQAESKIKPEWADKELRLKRMEAAVAKVDTHKEEITNLRKEYNSPAPDPGPEPSKTIIGKKDGKVYTNPAHAEWQRKKDESEAKWRERRIAINKRLRNLRDVIKRVNSAEFKSEMTTLKQYLNDEDNKYNVKVTNRSEQKEKRKVGVHNVTLTEDNASIAKKLLDGAKEETVDGKKGYTSGRIDEADKPLPKDPNTGRRQKIVYRNGLLVFLSGLLTAGGSMWKGLTED